MNTTTDYFVKMRRRIEDALIDSLPIAGKDAASECLAATVSGAAEAVRTGEDVALPCRELLFSGGKRWRPMLLVMFGTLRRVEETGEERVPLLNVDEVFRLCPLVEFPHTASLIHDDIEDGATARRGKPCAHITYGTDVALNAASWLYFKATECIDNAPLDDSAKCNLHRMYNAAICALHAGQARDIAWHKAESFFPTVAQYTSMCAMKTGALASLAVMAGSVVSGMPIDEADGKEELLYFHKAGMKLGTAFQALDDARNIMEGNPGKERGDDIVEGKKSLPVLMHLSEHPQDKERIIALFRRAKLEGIKSPAVGECIELLTDSGAAQSARERGMRLGRSAWDAMPTDEMKRFVFDLLQLDKEAKDV